MQRSVRGRTPGRSLSLDVVPAGDLKDWQTLPFEATIVGDYLVGRGVQDDGIRPSPCPMQ